MLTPDWSRLFPSGDFRWHLGLRPGDAPAFFGPTPEHAALMAERRRWIAETPRDYALLTPRGAPLLKEAAGLAGRWGATVAAGSPEALGVVWEPDFVLLSLEARGPVVEGGVVCFPTSWALSEKVGRILTETHGPVPRLNEELAARIATGLQRLPVSTAWERDNWGLVRSPELNHHPTLRRPRLDETTVPDQVWLRAEHQILFKMPQTGGVLFGIRIAHLPLLELMANPKAREGLQEALTTMPADAAEYKGLTKVRPKLLSWLANSAG